MCLASLMSLYLDKRGELDATTRSTAGLRLVKQGQMFLFIYLNNPSVFTTVVANEGLE